MADSRRGGSAVLAACVVLASVAGGGALAQKVAGRAQLAPLLKGYERPKDTPAPKDNLPTPERIALGRSLFFDPRLSGSGAISCASCHNPGLGWEDGLSRGIGNRGHDLGRHTPTILNTAWAEPLFWDGRAETLEDQAKGPIKSSAEMNMPHDEAVKRVSSIAGYRAAIDRAYPGEGVTIDVIAKAIASYERTIVSGKAPFDRWVAGDEHAISESAKRGFVVFNTKAKCASCHSGWRFTDDGFHDIGLASDDMGRAAIMPGLKILEHAFKTPTLRNVDQRAPYMHDGSVPTLEAVVDHYDHGFIQRESLSPEIKRLNLTTAEKADLVAFMRTLTSRDKAVELPTLPPQ